MHSWICGSRERKKLKVHANEGQCDNDNVTDVFTASSYGIDGDYMFGVTVGPIARILETFKVCVLHCIVYVYTCIHIYINIYIYIYIYIYMYLCCFTFEKKSMHVQFS